MNTIHPPMPNFEEEENQTPTENVTISIEEFVEEDQTCPETENTVVQTTQTKKKRGRAKTDTKSEEEKKVLMSQYYTQNKERKLLYKQAKRGNTKVPENRCYMNTTYLPRYIREGKTKPRVNLDWINYGGCHRVLTITQPSEELICLLKSQMKLNIEETRHGTEVLKLEA